MERTPINPDLPTQPPERFCKNQIVTEDNPNGLDCIVRLLENKGTICTFQSAEHARLGTIFLGEKPHPSADGVCRDFEAIE